MQEHRLSNSTVFRTWKFTGEVIEQTSETHTTLHQSAHIAAGNTLIPGQISSQLHRRQDVWLKCESGQERRFAMHGNEVPAMRASNRVTIIEGSLAKDGDGDICAVENHTTGDRLLFEFPYRKGLITVSWMRYWLGLVAASVVVVFTFFHNRDGVKGDDIMFSGFVIGTLVSVVLLLIRRGAAMKRVQEKIRTAVLSELVELR